MARCTECFHYEVCAKECRMVQIYEHTWDDYNQLDNVEKFCANYISAADVAPKSEVAREIFEEIDELLDFVGAMIGTKIIYCSKYAELKKKYTEDKE